MNFWKRFTWIGVGAVVLLCLIFVLIDETHTSSSTQQITIPSKDSAGFGAIK